MSLSSNISSVVSIIYSVLKVPRTLHIDVHYDTDENVRERHDVQTIRNNFFLFFISARVSLSFFVTG